ncbi:gluconate 2-dehydrogenase subunit 3 family protein [Lentimicrobium sp. L6]|uniref:gluconate 2-dehydrogenase subunit 3 family protein n=1 Tax=Lentimicrobium sp. L6 TaxID=2735916 RepID=UPI0015581F6C|nr:gluconate 2-dehydrogenase subunit 3 family protein [Lentimicrobium sp. L6]NPD85360.1 gluconate 2-dehydrogenase subunit 3 family protein [Lentimicrobium sp. L6]
MQRSQFLRVLLAGAVATQIPWWMACSSGKNQTADYSLNEEQQSILVLVQNFLFPADGNGPGAVDFKAEKYMQWVLSDENMDPIEKKYFINGLAWVEETAQEEKGLSFLELSEMEREEILELISKEVWGESWYSMNLNFIFEALLSDPIYGANMDKQSWNWLEHNPGHPRPIEEMKYGNFLNYVNQENKS